MGTEGAQRGLRDTSWVELISRGADAAALTFRAYTWLPGDFDSRDLHRLSGWALRRYRGAHRAGTETVAGLRDEIAASAKRVRQEHVRSLRRPLDPGPIFLGTTAGRFTFYGIVGDQPAANGFRTLEFEPEPGLDRFPVLPGMRADDADTGPIITDRITP